MRRAFLSLALSLTSVFVATLVLAQTPQPGPAFDQQLINQQKQFLQAVQNRDSSAVDASIADDFQGIQTNGDLYDRSEVIPSSHEAKAKDVRAYDFRVVKLTDNSAVVTYNEIVPGDHPRYRHMSDTWAKVDGRWKLKFRQITPNLWSANDLD
jgi:hypothetical protein